MIIVPITVCFAQRNCKQLIT